MSVALFVQHAKRMRRIVLSSVACLVLLCFFFSTLSYEPLAFREKLLNIKCAFWFSLQLLSETFFILRRNERNYEMHVHRFSRKVPVIHVKFYL